MQLISEKHKAPPEIVPVGTSESDIRQEVNRRTCKAGYTDSDGQQMISRSSGAGKGDAPRPINKDEYDKGYERIFGKKDLLNTWPRDEQGNLIN